MFRDIIEDWVKPILAFILMSFCMILLAAFLAWVAGPAEASVKRYTVAKSYIGLKEGTKSANRAMGVNTRSTPWCGQFAYVVAKRVGTKIPSGHMRARSWENAGTRVSKSSARKGDYLIIRTKRGDHVTIFSRRNGDRYCGVGGNQSNSVKESCYRASSVRMVVR